MKEYPITSIAPTICAILSLPFPAQAISPVIEDIYDDLKNYPRIAILAPDSLGDFPFQKWKNEMPFLKLLHDKRSIMLRSVMPPITPVNFASIVSGAVPHMHGVQSLKNEFKCETLFDVARTVGKRTAGIGRQGYTGAELLGRNADICGRAPEEEKDAGVEKITIEIVRQHQPTFLISQLGITDDVIHQYGPSSKMVIPILQETDQRLERLTFFLLKQGYGIIIHADHGQHDVEKNLGKGDDPNFDLYDLDNLPGIHDGTDFDADTLVPCTWVCPN